MKTELFTVSRIFTETLYRIPDYQRGYSWELSHLRDFWLDLEQLSGEEKHYTGVLTFEEVPDSEWAKWEEDLWIIRSRRYKPYFVVDGQQRLTTIIILIQSILEAAQSMQLNYTAPIDIRRKYIFDSKPEDAARSYIFGYDKDNPSYEFLKKRVFLEESDVHLPDEATIYTKNLIAAKTFFNEQLNNMQQIQLEELFTKVTQQLVFNVYEISSDIDVFVTFETMNNRGKPLSTLELLKNRLIFLSTKLAVPEGREGILRRAINDSWKSAYHYLGKNDDRPLNDDEFLQSQLSYFYLTNIVKMPEKSDDEHARVIHKFYYIMDGFNRFLLNDLFSQKRIGNTNTKQKELPPLTREFIFEFSQNVKSSVELYFKLSTPAQSEFAGAEKIQLERIGRLHGHSPSFMLVSIYRREKNSKKRAQLLEQMERYYFCISLGSRGPNHYGRRANTPDYYTQYTSGNLTTEELTAEFENMTIGLFKEISIHETLHDWMKNGAGYYGWRSIKYFLYEYELFLQGKVKSSREKLNWQEFSNENYFEDYNTIEHIYPQRARDKYWVERFSGYSSNQKRVLRNSLGNLLPLSRPRNSSLGNKSFPEKLGNEKSKTGYKYGSYSENEVAMLSDWNANQILERGIRLLDFLEQRWKLTIGDRDQKIRALGLEFMKAKSEGGASTSTTSITKRGRRTAR